MLIESMICVWSPVTLQNVIKVLLFKFVFVFLFILISLKITSLSFQTQVQGFLSLDWEHTDVWQKTTF